MIIQAKEHIANPLVSVAVITYNHGRYIAQCIDSLLEQDAPFDCEIVVADDCSKDNARDILKEYQKRYPEKIKLLFQDTNQGMIGNYAALLHQCKGKYIAEISGDDFWCDTHKLQKQVETLELHPECDLCYTNCYSCNGVGEINKTPMFKYNQVTFESHLLNTGYLAPGSWMFRRSILDYFDMQDWFTDESLAVALDVLHHSKFIFLDEPMYVYRIHDGSAAAQTDPKKMWRYLYGLFKMQIYYAEKYEMSKDFINKLKIQEYHGKCFAAIEAGDEQFIEEGIRFCEKQGMVMKWFVESCREYVKYKNQYMQISQSKAYRLGKRILKPLKKFRC